MKSQERLRLVKIEMNHNCILDEWKTLTIVRLLPLQVNQGHLRHSNIIINNREQYMYDEAIHLRYALFVGHVMLPITMGHYMAK